MIVMHIRRPNTAYPSASQIPASTNQRMFPMVFIGIEPIA